MTLLANLTHSNAFRLVAVMSIPLALAACGNDANETPPTDTTPVVDTTPAPAPTPTPAPAPEPAPEPAADAGAYEPGPLRFRVVNLLDQPVDVYVRSTGLVRAYPAEMGVTAGGITEFYNPPAGGSYVVTTAGAGDATCVTGCTHFITNETLHPDDGDAFTVILYDAAGTARAMRLWETAPAARIGQASNAMAAADPATGLVVVTAVALTGADFGLRLGFADIAGCQEPVNLTNVLVGGNQTPAFAYPGDTADVLLYGNQDRECSGAPVGGPFTVTGGPGTRTHLILSGSPEAMAGLALAMEEPAAP
ncbi:MAG: hypothetical protein KIT43_02470 [Bauldia sp.]|nr:hypothetical protein [Bauldia sp.]